MNDKKKEKIKDEEIKKIVTARLKILPSDKKLSVGSEGEFTRDELIKHVESGDELGKKIIEIQLEYLRLLKEGIFYERNTSSHETKT